MAPAGIKLPILARAPSTQLRERGHSWVWVECRAPGLPFHRLRALAEIWALMEMQAPLGGAASGVAAPGGPAGGQTALPATLAHPSPRPDGCSCCST